MKNPIDNCIWKDYPQGSITQWFGENVKLYHEAIGTNGHNGVDIVAPWNSPLYAVESGVVVEVNFSHTGFGRHLRFISSKPDDKGEYREWTYGHCQSILVNVGDTIQAGQQIATMGNTGFVISGATPFWKYNPYAGTHLHLGLRKVIKSKTGWSYPNSNIKIEVLNYQNGFKGAVDFVELFKDNSEEEQIKGLQLQVISLANTVINLLQSIITIKTK